MGITSSRGTIKTKLKNIMEWYWSQMDESYRRVLHDRDNWRSMALNNNNVHETLEQVKRELSMAKIELVRKNRIIRVLSFQRHKATTSEPR